MQAAITDIDPFDLPEWLGDHDVVWRADAGLRTGYAVRGRLTADGVADLACDLLAVDEAYPQPVVDDASRSRVHLAWRHGQVLIGTRHPEGGADAGFDAGSDVAATGRLVLAVPGTRFDPDLVLDALGRLARAVGAKAERYSALLRLSG